MPDILRNGRTLLSIVLNAQPILALSKGPAMLGSDGSAGGQFGERARRAAVIGLLATDGKAGNFNAVQYD